MMIKKLNPIATALMTIIALLLAFPTLAQDETGSIRGTVFRDVNENGLCSNEGEVRLGDIPIELVNDDDQELIRTITAADGTYVHANATLGLWRVTVVPGSGWRVTSQQTREVVISTDQPDAAQIDFCIVEIQSDGGDTTLPESGAVIAPPLLFAAIAGLLLIVAGGALVWRGKQQQ